MMFTKIMSPKITQDYETLLHASTVPKVSPTVVKSPAVVSLYWWQRRGNNVLARGENNMLALSAFAPSW